MTYATLQHFYPLCLSIFSVLRFCIFEPVCAQLFIPSLQRKNMDTGKEFWTRHISEEPVKRIQESQKAIQHNNHVNKFVHLAGRSSANTMLTSKLIPGAFGLVGVPVLAYGVYSLWTENSNM